jgi:hypothetical protein
MATITWLKIIPVIGILVRDLVAALADGKITVDEIIDTIVDVVGGLGLAVSLDANGIAFVKKMLSDIWNMVADKKITQEEAVDLVTSIAVAFNSKVETTAIV